MGFLGGQKREGFLSGAEACGEREKKKRKKKTNKWMGGSVCRGTRTIFQKGPFFESYSRAVFGRNSDASFSFAHTRCCDATVTFFMDSAEMASLWHGRMIFLSPYVHFDAGGCGEYEFAKDFFGEKGSEHALLHGYFT